MVTIYPYIYNKVSNIKEHNDIVDKVNEIIDVVNAGGGGDNTVVLHDNQTYYTLTIGD